MKYPNKFPRQLAILVVVVAVAIIVVLMVPGKSSPSTKHPVSTAELTAALWQDYKQHYWHASGQTVDPGNHNLTTSEAQGYTMLRAVWSGDKPTFQATWGWTQQHLQRSDQLFSWEWGKKADGSAGILTGQGGQNTASDADTDITLALLIAGNRWHDISYTRAAQAIIPAIWDQEVVTIQGQPYLTADNLEKNSPQPLINPSYFAPYAYRWFANFDQAHPWDQLVAQSYQTIRESSQQQLGSASSAGLPPDWVQINTQTGQLSASSNPAQDTNFGFDAFRTVWRTALDYQWNQAAEAKNTLASFSALTNDWDHDHKLYAIYDHSGKPTVNYPSIALYGGTLGYFQVMQPDIAKTIYRSQLASLYDTGRHRLKQSLSYYDNNWAWFGVALYAHQLMQPALSGSSQ